MLRLFRCNLSLAILLSLLSMLIMCMFSLRQVHAASSTTSPYGSITYSRSLKQSFFAFADSKVAAEIQAWDACAKAGEHAGHTYKIDCDSVVWVHNGYLSIAVATNGAYGSGWGSTAEISEHFAVNVCKSHGGKDCNKITTKHTSLNPQQPSEGATGFRIPGSSTKDEFAKCDLKKLECKIAFNHDTTQTLGDIIGGTPPLVLAGIVTPYLIKACLPIVVALKHVGALACIVLIDYAVASILNAKQIGGKMLANDQGKGVLLTIKLTKSFFLVSLTATPR